MNYMELTGYLEGNFVSEKRGNETVYHNTLNILTTNDKQPNRLHIIVPGEVLFSKMKYLPVLDLYKMRVNKGYLLLDGTVMVSEYEWVLYTEPDCNSLDLTGEVAEAPCVHQTYTGRTVCKVILNLVNGKGESSLVTCIGWEKTAPILKKLTKGEKTTFSCTLVSRSVGKYGDIKYEPFILGVS